MSHISIFEKFQNDDPVELARLIAVELDKTVLQQDTIEIIGKGHGANKTTTGQYGITVTEDFGLNDELFLHWQIPKIMYEYKKPILHMEFAPVIAEVGKLFSLELSISPQNDGSLINDLGVTHSIVDTPIPTTAFESFSISFEIPDDLVGFDDLHMKLKRTASSNDLSDSVALHHASMEYQKYQRDH
jgi:hypothetical protein